MRGDERMDFGRDDRVDGMIDAALRSYAEPEVIPEARVAAARVMERARAPEDKRRKFWRWVAAVPAAGCLLVVLVVAWLREPRVAEIAWGPKAPEVVSQSNKAIPLRLKPDSPGEPYGTADAVPLQSGESPRRVMQSEAQRQLPKLEVFPTPRPATQEEQALMAFSQEATQEAKKQVVEAEKHLGDPITIAELKIRPLDDKAGNTEQATSNGESEKEKE